MKLKRFLNTSANFDFNQSQKCTEAMQEHFNNNLKKHNGIRLPSDTMQRSNCNANQVVI